MEPLQKSWVCIVIVGTIAIVFLLATIVLSLAYVNCSQSSVDTSTQCTVDPSAQTHVVPRIPPLSPRQDVTTGVNAGSFLNIEDFFHASSKYTRDVSAGVNGGLLWPVVSSTDLRDVLGELEGLSSEGHIFKRLIQIKGGSSGAVATMHQYRRQYYTEHDFRDMQQAGITKLRLPIGWWILADANVDGFVVDPYADTDIILLQVPADPRFLEDLLDWCSKYGIEVLLDIHAMPGGSSDGSYNGVKGVQDPVFWDRFLVDVASGVEDQGIAVWKKTMAWRDSLSPARRLVITGLQPMNEPALNITLTGIGSAVLRWSKLAVDAFKEHYQSANDVPNLFMNFIDGPFVGGDFSAETHQFMLDNLGGAVTSKNFFLDVHSYMAWSGVDAQSPLKGIQSYLGNFDSNNAARKSRAGESYRLATSEYSAAFNHISSECVPDPEWITLLFRGQEQSMIEHGIESYFWSWRCSSMEHRHYWDFRSVLGLLPPAT